MFLHLVRILVHSEPMTQQHYTDFESKALEQSEHEIKASIPADVMQSYRTKALQELGADVELPGFRKGNVPEDMLVEHIGEDRILERAANLALSAIYPRIVTDNNIDAIGSPRIQITKMAADNPLEFTATTAVMPDITLPDYAKIAREVFAQEEKEIVVTDAELEETLTHVRRQRAQIDQYEKQKGEGIEEPQPVDVKDDELPELTDEFVKTLGDFTDVADFTQKVRDNLKAEKELREREKKRIETVEKIIDQATIELPQLMIDQELQRIQMQVEGQVAQTGTKFDDYLANIGKTLDELKKEWEPEAVKRAKLQLILNTIAKEQNITPDADEVAHEIEYVKKHYPQAEEENIRIYVETTKRNEAVFQYLEQAGADAKQ